MKNNYKAHLKYLGYKYMLLKNTSQILASKIVT